MNDLHYGSFACTNEIKPKFPPKVQQVWNDCGTFVTSMEAEQGAKEIEFFVGELLRHISVDCNFAEYYSYDALRKKLVSEGYIHE